MKVRTWTVPDKIADKRIAKSSAPHDVSRVPLVLTKSAVVAGSLALIWLLESVVPSFADRRHRIRHDARNVVLGGINAIVASVLFAGLMLTVTEYAAGQEFGLLRWIGLSGGPAWVASFLLLDAWQYWWHRLNHAVPLLWRFHAVHHADAELDGSSAVRFHTGEIIASAGIRLAVLPLAGITLPQLLAYELIAFPVIAFHHANIRWPRWCERWGRLVLVTPGVHRVHHSAEPRNFNRNFASVFSVWDRLFGSFRWVEPAELGEFGLRLPTSVWRPFGSMLAMPLRRPPAASGVEPSEPTAPPGAGPDW